MAEELKGIEGTLALLQALQDLAVDAKKVLADGKVDLADLPVAMNLLSQLGDFTKAIQGINELPAEIKDLSADEINQLVAKVFDIVAQVKAA